MLQSVAYLKSLQYFCSRFCENLCLVVQVPHKWQYKHNKHIY